MRVSIVATLLMVPVAGCAPNPTSPRASIPQSVVDTSVVPPPSVDPALPRLAWARNDGRLISGDPNLTAQAQSTIAECGATSPPFRTADGVAGEACMGERGYYLRELSS